MNHHLSSMPHGQPPMGPSRRQQDFPYNPGPTNMRSPYMGYPPHMNNGMNGINGMNGMNGHMPPAYIPQQFSPWYPPPYAHMQFPPRQYQPLQPPQPLQAPYGPMIVSSYPHVQPIMAPNHMIPAVPLQQPRTSTPLLSTSISQVSTPPVQHAMHDHPSLQHQSPHYHRIPSPTPTKWTIVPPKEPTPEKPIYGPPLPWLSARESPFPARAPHKRTRKPMITPVEFPMKDGKWIIGPKKYEAQLDDIKPEEPIAHNSAPQTPSVSRSTDITSSTTAKSQTQQDTKPVSPIIPAVPILPSTPPSQKNDTSSVLSDYPNSMAPSVTDNEHETTPTAETPAKPVANKTWAELLRAKTAAKTTSAPTSSESTAVPVKQSESLADVLGNLGEDVSQYSDKIAFLEPRGLVNTGNMCYMNSVLQILVSCVPFHQFLDHVGRRAAHSFQSDVPLIDAMIMFMREFRIIDAATSEDQLRMRLRPTELEQYGEAFVPEFVYEMIRLLPRFRDMRRGHQQDAQEFLGFLLEELHEECDRAAKHFSKAQDALNSGEMSGSSNGGDWLEVGHKQKAAVTQSSGDHATESPITRIFGGKLRSEFKVPGNKTSVTMEPYQPLQLDIGAPDVHNIIDALKGLTKPESIQGDFNSSRGPNVTATKQMFIETLPPVLILHLKRFHYDSVTGATQKIWKKVGYPLDLEIPREVFPAHRRNAMTAQGGYPKYRLMGVIYHHGKNASGGHYTVDVRRQDGREWIRMDDTALRRVRSEDVAEAGGEEDPKVLAAALEKHKHDQNPRSNIYDHFDQEKMESADSEKGWSQVNNGGSNGHFSKKSANGTSPSSGPSTGVRTPLARYSANDNRVAYLLFYQRMD